jgi:hypothetical protein
MREKLWEDPKIQVYMYKNTDPQYQSTEVAPCVFSSPKSDWDLLRMIVGGDH